MIYLKKSEERVDAYGGIDSLRRITGSETYDVAVGVDEWAAAGSSAYLRDGEIVLGVDESKIPYQAKRLAEYPELSDIVDAMLKARAGEEAELAAIVAKRNEIKAKYPKV